MTTDAGLALELRDQLRLGVVWDMDSEMRQVQQERFRVMTLDEIERVVGQEIRQVLPLRIIDFGIGGEIEVFSVGFDGLSEAALGWMEFFPISQVPFTEHRCRIASRRELVGEGVDL